jgi:hypothetical protein
MSTTTSTLWEIIAMVAVVGFYGAMMYAGVRVGKGDKWPLGKEATLAVGFLLTSQWLTTHVLLYTFPDKKCFEIVAGGLLWPFFIVPGFLGLLWGWIYLRRRP